MGAGAGTGAEGFGAEGDRVIPHLEQNFAFGFKAAPQLGQAEEGCGSFWTGAGAGAGIRISVCVSGSGAGIRISVFGSGCGAGAGAGDAAMVLPHLEQNFAPGFKTAPQLRQTEAALAVASGFAFKPSSLYPHDLQNFASLRFSN